MIFLTIFLLFPSNVLLKGIFAEFKNVVAGHNIDVTFALSQEIFNYGSAFPSTQCVAGMTTEFTTRPGGTVIDIDSLTSKEKIDIVAKPKAYNMTGAVRKLVYDQFGILQAQKYISEQLEVEATFGRQFSSVTFKNVDATQEMAPYLAKILNKKIRRFAANYDENGTEISKTVEEIKRSTVSVVGYSRMSPKLRLTAVKALEQIVNVWADKLKRYEMLLQYFKQNLAPFKWEFGEEVGEHGFAYTIHLKAGEDHYKLKAIE